MSGRTQGSGSPHRRNRSAVPVALVRGKDVNRFSLEESGLYAVLPHDPKDLRKVLSLEDLAKIGPGLWDFLEGWIPALINRSPYGKVQPSNDYPWGIHGPTEHLKRDLPIALSRYMHSLSNLRLRCVRPQWIRNSVQDRLLPEQQKQHLCGRINR